MGIYIQFGCGDTVCVIETRGEVSWENSFNRGRGNARWRDFI